MLVVPALTVLGLAGCAPTAASGGSGITASGRTLKIFASLPGGSSAPAWQQDVFAAEQLAFRQGQSAVAGYRLALVKLTASKISDDARAAIADKSAIAYLGELAPGTSADSIGITNAQDLLQVSPTDTAVELTQTTAAVPGAPGSYYESLSTYGRTFARVVPTSAQEAAALVSASASVGVHELYVASDGSAYGAALAAAAVRAAGHGVTVKRGPATAAGFSGSGADGMLLAAASPGLAESLLPAVAAADPGAKLLAPSALDDPGLAAALSGRVAHLYVSLPGLLRADLPPAGQAFLTSFRSAYGHAPDPRAVFGYEAVSALLSVLQKAGGAANNRGIVTRDFFSIKNRDSAIGTYSIDSSGDTSLSSFVLARLRGGALVPFERVPAAG